MTQDGPEMRVYVIFDAALDEAKGGEKVQLKGCPTRAIRGSWDCRGVTRDNEAETETRSRLNRRKLKADIRVL